MNKKLYPQAHNYIKKHKRKSIWYKLVLSMAAVVVFITTYMLILPAITMEKDTVCGITEHTHTDQCYETAMVLTCGMEEGEIVGETSSDGVISGEALEHTGEVHVHTDECYSEEKTLICTLEEHEHTDECRKHKEVSGGGGADKVDGELVYADLTDALESITVVEKSEIFSGLAANDTISGYDVFNNTNISAGEKSTSYNPITGVFESTLRLNFITNKDEIQAGNGLFEYKLPGEVFPHDDIQLGVYLPNTEGDENTFEYCFIKDEDGGYRVRVRFTEEYMTEKLPNITGDVTGWVSFEATISKDAVKDDGSVEVNFDGISNPLIIPEDEIENYPNATALGDIFTQKTTSGYNEDTNTITYTVTVFSKAGSGGTISIEDILTNLDTSGLTLGENVSVSVNKAQHSASIYQQWDGSLAIADSGVIGTPTYVTPDYTVDTSTGELLMTLPALDESTQDGVMNAYDITYTYTLADNSAGEGLSINLNNKLTATSTLKNNTDITSSSSANVNIGSKSLISKWATMGTDGKSVTWTITLGNGTTDLSGKTLTDTMFAELKEEDINIQPSEGYTFTYDTDGNISGITFDENCTNKNYTVVYTTAIDTWGERPQNTAEFDGKTVNAGVNTVGGGITKTNSKVGEVNGIQTLRWFVTFSVPANGIPKDTVIKDQLEQYNPGHYFTYDDALAIRNTLTSIPGSVSDKLGDIQFYSPDLGRYCTLDDGEVTTATTFTEYRCTVLDTILPADCEGEDASFAYNYTSHLDTIGLTGYKEYKNYLSAGPVTTGSTYAVMPKAVKTDGNEGTGLTQITNDNGTLTWLIKVDIRDSFNVMNIVDTLPVDVELRSLEIAYDGNYNYTTIIGDTTSATYPVSVSDFSFNGITLDASVTEGIPDTATDEQSKQYEVKVDITNTYNVSSRNYIYLKFNCQVAERLRPAYGEDKYSTTLTNNAEVTIDGGLPYYASQTQHLTIDNGAPNDKPVSKDGMWDRDSQRLKYSIEINPTGTKFGDKATYTFIDTLSYQNGAGIEGSYTSLREYKLDPDTVKLYKVEEDGTRSLYEDWDYNYKTINNLNWDGLSYSVQEIITAELPNEIHFILEYEYIVRFDRVGVDSLLAANNTAKIDLVGDYSDTSSTGNEQHQSAVTSAGVDRTYTIYKVAEGHMRERLEGAKFKLYYYDDVQGIYRETDKGYFITDANGEIKVDYSDLGLLPNTLYYLVEVVPPVGYELPELPEPLYFYVSESGQANHLPANLPDDTVNLAVETPKKFIENVAVPTTSVTVDKKWYDLDGITELDTEELKDVNGNLPTIEAVISRKYKKRTDSSANYTKVTWSISYNYGQVYSGSKYMPVGEEGCVVIERNETTWSPSLDIQIGDINYNEPYYSSGSAPGWDGKVYKCSFTVTDGLNITGNIGASQNQFNVSVGIDPKENDHASWTDDSSFKLIQSISADADGSWKYTFDNLPVGGLVDDTYADFIYYVSETSMEGYRVEYQPLDGSGENGAVTIKNIKTENKSINVSKKWIKDDGTTATPSVDEIEFDLYRKIIDETAGRKKLSLKIYSGWSQDENALIVNHNGYYPTNSIVQLKIICDEWYDMSSTSNFGELNNAYITLSDKQREVVNGTTQYYYVLSFNMSEDIVVDNLLLKHWNAAIFKADEPAYTGGDPVTEVILAYEKVNSQPYTISAADEWIANIDITGLPVHGSIGEYSGNFIYYIQENLPSGSTLDSIIQVDSNGVPVAGASDNVIDVSAAVPEGAVDNVVGNYIITNKQEDVIVLPSTGGKGALLSISAGALLMTGSSFCLYIRLVKRRKNIFN